MKHTDEPVFFHMDGHAIIRDLKIRNRSVIRIIRVHHSVLLDAGEPVPTTFRNILRVIDTGIPTVKHHETWVKSPRRGCCYHLAEMVVLRHLVTVLIVNPIIDRECVNPISPDKGYQTYPFHNFMMLPAPLEIRQVDLPGVDLVYPRIIANQPSASLLYISFNLGPQRLRSQ